MPSAKGETSLTLEKLFEKVNILYLLSAHWEAVFGRVGHFVMLEACHPQVVV